MAVLASVLIIYQDSAIVSQRCDIDAASLDKHLGKLRKEKG